MNILSSILGRLDVGFSEKFIEESNDQILVIEFPCEGLISNFYCSVWGFLRASPTEVNGFAFDGNDFDIPFETPLDEISGLEKLIRKYSIWKLKIWERTAF